jgi:starch synthase
MKILFVASEATPFAKTGGLADVVGSLPKELKRRGHDVRIIIPRYRGLTALAPSRPAGVQAVVDSGPFRHRAELEETAVDGIPVYLVGSGIYFDRAYLYGTPSGDYPDNHRRYGFFCRAVLAFMERIGFCPDILHCHDWQTALIPILLKHDPALHPFFTGTRVVFTIHNLAYQGVFPREALTELGLPAGLFSMAQLEFYGKINLMKGAIQTADVITTVSPTYREEILTKTHGCGLEGVLAGRREDLRGILNGIDYAEWNPATDRNLVANYTFSSLEGKKANKTDVQRLLGLEENDRIPLLGMVSRIVAQKGFDLLASILPRLEREPLQLAILGTGDEKFVAQLREVTQRHVANIAITIDFAPHLAAKLYGGCDMLLMPSQFEPCGLSQLVALRYGTVPVVRKTGGLADSVIDPADNPGDATGFTFDGYSGPALMTAIERAVRTYGDGDVWRGFVQRGMTSDFSWKRSAAGFETLYREILARKGRERNGTD